MSFFTNNTSITSIHRSAIEILKASELNENSTRYDRFIAGPSDGDAKLMWILWSTISAVSALFCLALFFGIITSPKARTSAFNVYILFLVFPDIVFNVCCCITCAINAAAGEYISTAMCEWQSWYCVFGFTANSWMNAVVAVELHRLLRDCKKAHHYRPPRINKVILRSSIVYIYSAFVASWTLFGFLPHHAGPTAGLACVPVEFSIGSTIFFWCAFFPAFIGIPFSIFLYVCWDVYRNKMLPANGRTRHLFFFFMRLALVFVIMWLPTIILIFAIGVPDVWLSFAGGSWSHLQGIVSVLCCLTKSDVRKAVVNALLCRSHEDSSETEDATWYGFIRRSIRRSSSVVYIQSSRLRDVFENASGTFNITQENDVVNCPHDDMNHACNAVKDEESGSFSDDDEEDGELMSKKHNNTTTTILKEESAVDGEKEERSRECEKEERSRENFEDERENSIDFQITATKWGSLDSTQGVSKKRVSFESHNCSLGSTDISEAMSENNNNEGRRSSSEIMTKIVELDQKDSEVLADEEPGNMDTSSSLPTCARDIIRI